MSCSSDMHFGFILYLYLMLHISYPQPNPNIMKFAMQKKVTALLQMKISPLHFLALIYDLVCKIFYS